jgi:hypothetical protein
MLNQSTVGNVPWSSYPNGFVQSFRHEPYLRHIHATFFEIEIWNESVHEYCNTQTDSMRRKM